MNIAITVNEPDLFAANISQEPGAVYPSFNLKKLPHGAKPEDLEDWLDYDPPDLDINVGGTIWTCQATRTSVTGSRESGIDIDIQYIPKPFAILQDSGYGKQVIFLSCLLWQKEQYTVNLDEEVTTLYYKHSDEYIATGWTVNEILEIIGELAGVEITSDLPLLHVQNATLVLEKGQPFLNFMLSLLPTGGFTYAWHSHNNALHVSLVQPAIQAFTVPTEATNIEYGKEQQTDYNCIEITGGLQKPGTIRALRIGSLNIGSGSPSSRVNAILTEDLPEETRQVGEYTQTTYRTRTVQADGNGNPFAVTGEIENVYGPIFNKNGDLSKASGLIRQVTVSHSYENNDAAIFQVPRLIETLRTISGYAYAYVIGCSPTGYGKVWYLSEDLEILDDAQYLSMSPSPDILCTAKVTWQSYESHIEAKLYTGTPNVTQDWPEGSNREQTQETTRTMFNVADVWVDCVDDPHTALSRIIQALSQESTPTIATITTASRQVEMVENRVALKCPKSYEFQSTTMQLNTNTGKVEHDAQVTPIDSANIPSQPTQYRLAPLKATVGDAGAQLVIPFSGSIPTANLQDFEHWAGILYYQITHPKRALSVTSATEFIPPGYRYANGTVAGFQIQQRGPEQVVQYSIE